MADHRQPTLDDMRRLGAEDGRALAAALAFYVRSALTQKHVDEMLRTVHRGTARMVDDLRRRGLSEDLVLAYGRACSEAIMHDMACHARTGGRQVKSTKWWSRLPHAGSHKLVRSRLTIA